VQGLTEQWPQADQIRAEMNDYDGRFIYANGLHRSLRPIELARSNGEGHVPIQTSESRPETLESHQAGPLVHCLLSCQCVLHMAETPEAWGCQVKTICRMGTRRMSFLVTKASETVDR
jgi:hypothetical protein